MWCPTGQGPHSPLFVCTVSIVLHPVPGGRLSARIRNSRGEEVAGSQYDLLQHGEDFTFRFKKPHRDRSGKYTLVFDYDGAETEKDIMVNFLGN